MVIDNSAVQLKIISLPILSESVFFFCSFICITCSSITVCITCSSITVRAAAYYTKPYSLIKDHCAWDMNNKVNTVNIRGTKINRLNMTNAINRIKFLTPTLYLVVKYVDLVCIIINFFSRAFSHFVHLEHLITN